MRRWNKLTAQKHSVFIVKRDLIQCVTYDDLVELLRSQSLAAVCHLLAGRGNSIRYLQETDH